MNDEYLSSNATVANSRQQLQCITVLQPSRLQRSQQNLPDGALLLLVTHHGPQSAQCLRGVGLTSKHAALPASTFVCLFSLSLHSPLRSEAESVRSSNYAALFHQLTFETCHLISQPPNKPLTVHCVSLFLPPPPLLFPYTYSMHARTTHPHAGAQHARM